MITTMLHKLKLAEAEAGGLGIDTTKLFKPGVYLTVLNRLNVINASITEAKQRISAEVDNKFASKKETTEPTKPVASLDNVVSSTSTSRKTLLDELKKQNNK